MLRRLVDAQLYGNVNPSVSLSDRFIPFVTRRNRPCFRLNFPATAAVPPVPLPSRCLQLANDVCYNYAPLWLRKTEDFGFLRGDSSQFSQEGRSTKKVVGPRYVERGSFVKGMNLWWKICTLAESST